MTSSVAAEHPLVSQGCMVSAKRVLAVLINFALKEQI